MSVLYIGLVLRMRDVSAFSSGIGWLKGLGTGMVTVFVFLAYPENAFVQTLGVLTALLDATYLVVLRLRQRGRLAPPLTLALDGPAFGGLSAAASARAD
jgi:hypothetical protein